MRRSADAEEEAGLRNWRIYGLIIAAFVLSGAPMALAQEHPTESPDHVKEQQRKENEFQVRREKEAERANREAQEAGRKLKDAGVTKDTSDDQRPATVPKPPAGDGDGRGLSKGPPHPY